MSVQNLASASLLSLQAALPELAADICPVLYLPILLLYILLPPNTPINLQDQQSRD